MTYFSTKQGGHKTLSIKLLACFTLFLTLLIGSATIQAQDDPGFDVEAWKSGKTLFKSNCASCHHPAQDMTGPALGGVLERWQEAGDHDGKSGEEWMYTWIRNWNDAVAGGNPYAKEIQNWDASAMNLFVALKDEDIDQILLYVDNYTYNPNAAAVASGPVASGDNGASEKLLTTILWSLFALLVVIVLVLGRVTSVLDRLNQEKEGTYEPKPFNFKKIGVALGLALVVLVGYNVVNGAIDLGRQQGYMPDQPIKFSHALHAGTHNIECQFCHHGASESKHSNIPSVNVCMNCHKNVYQGPQYGTEEIAKIYDAAGWDEETQAYTGEQKPVEWVRIHNLPDHVYFNHAQHVNAGGLECQTCHGPIQEMETVYQYAPLSMGWCVNCHRQTEVKFGDNDYYSSVYERYHEELKNGERTKVTVEDIGGTNCAKCHY